MVTTMRINFHVGAQYLPVQLLNDSQIIYLFQHLKFVGSSVPHVLVYQHHFHIHMVHLAPVNSLGAADALRASAVITVIQLERAGRFVPMPLGV